MKVTILSKEEAQKNKFRSFLGGIEDTINCFRDLLTFSMRVIIEVQKEFHPIAHKLPCHRLALY